MNEQISNPEGNELPNKMDVLAVSKSSKKEECVGTFEESEDGSVIFKPNSQKDESGFEILESTFQGKLSKHVYESPDGYRMYSLEFDDKKNQMNVIMSFGFRRQNKDKTLGPREIHAEMGRFGDWYEHWYLSDENWEKLNSWLQTKLQEQ